VPAYTPSWSVRLLRRLAGRFGPGAVLLFVSGMQRGVAHVYDAQPEAKEVGMPRGEHECTLLEARTDCGETETEPRVER
jgi:hypothetical protein